MSQNGYSLSLSFSVSLCLALTSELDRHENKVPDECGRASLRGPRMDAWEAAQELLAESFHEPQIAEFQGPTDLTAFAERLGRLK